MTTTPQPASLPPGPEFQTGDLITDGTVDASVLSAGVHHPSRMTAGYRVRILSGNQRGRFSFIAYQDARTLAPQDRRA